MSRTSALWIACLAMSVGACGPSTEGGYIDETTSREAVTEAPSAPTPTAYTATAAWTTESALAMPLSGPAAVARADGRIFVMGGFGPALQGTPVDTVEAYTPSTNTWTSTDIAPMPTARYHLAAVRTPDNRIYAIGGTNNQGAVTNVEIYTPAANTWAKVASLPSARYGLAAAVGSDGRIYAIGGAEGVGSKQTVIKTVWAYSPTENQWTRAASMPFGNAFISAVAANDGLIYVFGGPSVLSYDPKKDAWTTVSDLPTPREGLAAELGSDGLIYTIGGESGSALGTVEAFDPSTKAWTTVTSMPTARYNHRAVRAANGKIYAIAGFNGSEIFDNVEALNP